MTYIIVRERCCGSKDTACVDICPVDCIYGADEDWEQLYIHPEECIDCGLCVDVFPVESIFARDDVPVEYNASIVLNYKHFNLDSPED